ncbi:MAG: hypothetical protein H6706_15575 [Myxococcales bacterium]|nr:hypothetical protein [Myxococcales bacterium]
MRLLALSVLYGLLGVGVAAWRIRRGPPAHAWSEAALLVGLWPLLGPLCFSRRAPADPLGDRLARAARKAAEIDRLLATPDFDEGAVARQVATLEAAGQTQAAAAARRVLANIHRLQGLKRRHAEELAVVEALQHQLRTQVQVMRLAGQADGGLDELVGALEVRVEALEDLLAEPLTS